MSKKGKKGNNTNTATNDDELNQLRERLKTVEGQITTLKDDNKLLKAGGPGSNRYQHFGKVEG